MRRATKLPELLCPAGSMEALIAAVSGGADAVYIGGKKFGARAYAKNFELEEIRDAVIFCHMHSVRLFVAVNTLVYDRELPSALEYCESLYSLGVDALIVCDLGLISLLRERLPDFELHASTQMGVHNKEGADLAYSLGLRRVVLARECSGEDIAAICEESLAECEIFVHGALCVCHSGQCLFSSMVGGRSGNRGECAQPCRLPFDKGYALSLKDLSLAKHIREIIRSGAASLKIEGRMKSPEYVYRVASVFRRLLDENRDADDSEMRELSEVFSRGGFTDGYFVGKKGSRMTGVRSEEDKLRSRSLEQTSFEYIRRKIEADATLKLGEPSRLTLRLTLNERLTGNARTLKVTVEGASPEPARSSPLDADGVKTRLMKFGGTPFTLSGDGISLTLDSGVNLSPSELNSLRRRATELLVAELSSPIVGRRAITADFDFARVNSLVTTKTKLGNTAVFYNPELFFKLRKNLGGFFDIVFLPIDGFCGEQDDASRFGVCVPPIIMENEWQSVTEELKRVRALGVKFALVSNIGHIRPILRLGFTPIGDFRLNASNLRSRALLHTLGVEEGVVSPELTVSMARDIGWGTVVQGRIPLMLTERCFISENFGCEKCRSAVLRDRTGGRFPMMKEYGHRNLIFNSVLTYMGDKKAELDSAGLCHRHFIFSTENERSALLLIDSYKRGKRLEAPIRRIGKR